MKKTTYIAALFLIFGMAATSCKKKETANPKEMGIESILNRAAYNSFDEENYSYELGFEFTSSKNGKISKLGLKLPETGIYKVSLWDSETELKLDSVMVTNSDSSLFNYQSITARSIVAGKKYVVSVNTSTAKDYFCASTSALFPFTVGSISFLNQREQGNDGFTFPKTTVRIDRYCGLASFVFQAD